MQVAVVSLRYGAGVKGKVIEALSWGLPIVTTGVGAEGLPDAERVMSVADQPREFATAVVAAIHSEEQVEAALQRYPAYLREHYSKDRARSILIEDFGDPCLDVPRG